MKKYALRIIFLLFNIIFINGYTLTKIELNNVTNVYEVKESGSSVTITHPNDTRPTLREIVYLHIIEKPYGEGDKVKDDLIGVVGNKAAIPDKTRTFTNGHGFQFPNEDNDSDKPKDDYNDDSEQQNEENKNNDISESDEYYDNDDRQDEENENNYTSESDEHDDSEEVVTETEASASFTDKPEIDSSDEFANDNGPQIDDEYVDSQISGDDSNETLIIDDIDVRFGDDDLINKLITKALGTTQEEQKRRKKRQIDYTNLRDAPSLPELKLDMFPDYIKTILMEEPDTHQQTKQAENFEEEIERQVEQLEKAANHPPIEKGGSGHKREARTYGMSLAGDSGVVWNDVSAPHVTYHVGELETSKPEEVPDTTTSATTTKPMYEPTKDDNDKNENSDESTEKVDSDELKDIQESFVEIDKILNELIKESTSKPDITQNKDETPKKPDSNNDITTEMTTTETANKNADSGHESSIQKPDNDKASIESSEEYTPDKNKTDDKKESNDRKDTNKETTKHRDENSKQKQFVMELMKNKYFWQWLQDSSSAYIEVVMKKVDVLIKAEVENQIKEYLKEHNNVISNCKPQDNSTSQNTTLDKPIQTNNITDEDMISTTQKPNVNSTLEKPIETSNVTNLGVENTTQNPIVNNTEQNKPDEIDTPVSNNNEAEDELARKHNNEESNNKKTDKPVKIEAQNIYGSSVGNGKVTNIFIFNISKESDFKNITSLNNGTNGVFVFGLDDKKEQENIKTDHKDENSKVTTTTTIKPENTKDQAENNNKESHESKDINDEFETNDESKENIIKDTTSNTENETNYEQTTSKEQSTTGDNHFNATLEPNTNREITTSTTEKAVEKTTKAAKESSENLSNEDNVVETDTTNSTASSSDIEPKPTDNSDTDSLLNDNSDDADDDITEEQPEKENNNTTDDTNTIESDDIDEVTDKDDTVADTEKNENKSKENEVDHNE